VWASSLIVKAAARIIELAARHAEPQRWSGHTAAAIRQERPVGNSCIMPCRNTGLSFDE
jgi:hypothetical protein